MVEHSAADNERVAKMHAGHCSERIDEIAAHPDAGRVVVAYAIQEAVFGRKKTRRHTRIEGECQEGEEIS